MESIERDEDVFDFPLARVSRRAAAATLSGLDVHRVLGGGSRLLLTRLDSMGGVSIEWGGSNHSITASNKGIAAGRQGEPISIHGNRWARLDRSIQGEKPTHKY